MIRRGFIRGCILIGMALCIASTTTAKSCLWKITSDTGTMYLQGSVHVLKAEHYPLAQAIEDAYAASEALVLEVDIHEMSSPEAQQQIIAKAMLPGTETLNQVLDEATYQRLSDACAEAGMPIAALSKFKPWFATMSLVLIKLQNLGFTPQYGLDFYFHGKAEADGKPIIGLETVEYQIDLFETLSEKNPNEFVTRALSDLDMMESDVSALEKAWQNGDIEALDALLSKSFEDYPDLYKTFVLDRNTEWFKRLKTLLDKPDVHMVVVGAGHLSGEGGLLSLLKKEGYTLEQL